MIIIITTLVVILIYTTIVVMCCQYLCYKNNLSYYTDLKAELEEQTIKQHLHRTPVLYADEHHHRELNAVMENDNQPWAQEMIELLYAFKHRKEELADRLLLDTRDYSDKYKKSHGALP